MHVRKQGPALTGAPVCARRGRGVAFEFVVVSSPGRRGTSRPRRPQERELWVQSVQAQILASLQGCRSAKDKVGAGQRGWGWVPRAGLPLPSPPHPSLQTHWGTRTQLWPCRPACTGPGGKQLLHDCDAPSECWGGPGWALRVGELEGGGAPSSPLPTDPDWAVPEPGRAMCIECPWTSTGIWELTFPGSAHSTSTTGATRAAGRHRTAMGNALANSLGGALDGYGNRARCLQVRA